MLWVAGSLVISQVRAYGLLRRLAQDGCPSRLGQAFAEYGQITRTLHLLALVNLADVGYRCTVNILVARIAARTGNTYGKHPAERAQILQNLTEIEPLLRAIATIEIDATTPLSQVVRHLENLT